MIGPFYNYPKQALVDKKIPKSKFYENIKINSKLKDLFIKQIDQIIWKYKLSPSSINIDSSSSVREIQIFEIFLKDKDVDLQLIRTIDQAVPYPILFHFVYKDTIKLVAANKKANDEEGFKWKVEDYFESDWISQIEYEKNLKKIPIITNLGKLYESFILELIPLEKKQNDNIKNHIEKFKLIEKLKKDIKRTESKLNNEKQFKKKMDLNTQLKNKKQQLNNLLEQS